MEKVVGSTPALGPSFDDRVIIRLAMNNKCLASPKQDKTALWMVKLMVTIIRNPSGNH